MQRIKNFDSTGLAPNGRLFAGDLNAIQDAAAALFDLAQNIGVISLTIGESGLQLVRFGASEARLSGALRTDGILRGLGGLFAGAFTTAQRDVITPGLRPFSLIIYNTTTARFEYNAGTDASPNWQSLVPSLGSGSITLSMMAPNSVDSSKVVDASLLGGDIAAGTITDVNVASANKDGAAGTPSMRTIGGGATQVVAGNDGRLTDQRTPTDNSVATAKIQANAVTPAKMQKKLDSGIVTSVLSTGVQVNFSTPFTAAPVVIFGTQTGNPAANGGAGEPANYQANFTSLDAAGMYVIHNQGGTRTIPWQAIGV